jgi:ADP-ribosyl-[dinitrogen reductase] hydrolase
MALCLANSLIARRDFVPYDQLVRYKWWYKHGYMSSTGQCFDIGAATSQSLREFEQRQEKFAKENKIPFKKLDKLSHMDQLSEFDVYCSEDGVAGNGALMRLAPVPLFFHRNIFLAIEFSGRSGQITHGDKKAADACRYYGALIAAALRGLTKNELLNKNFYLKHRKWFGEESLHEDIIIIARGSFKKTKGYEDGIRGKGYVVNALEAALWAFWSDNNSFEKGALNAVNLGDDTDTTAAIYGQLAGAYYGYSQLPTHWVDHVYARKFMITLSKWILYEGEQWQEDRQNSFTKSEKGTH